MSRTPCCVVIATYQRPGPLRRALESLRVQTWKPERVVVMDASPDQQSEMVMAEFVRDFQISYHRCASPSSAVQRNQGLDQCESPLVLFMDDDAVLYPQTLERLTDVFESKGDSVAGVGGRMDGFSHQRPSFLSWCYYRWQAGYSHPTYGGRLFGPAINCLACYEDAEGDLIPTQWLPTTCVLYRSDLVKQERFPDFAGYSFMEDVHLSARLAKSYELYFHAGAGYLHEDAPSTFKVSRRELARHRLQNQRRVAEEVMGCSGPKFEFHFFVHRLFASVSVLRQRHKDWMEELKGLWT